MTRPLGIQTADMESINAVPSADSADNVRMRDVIGNKSDTHAGDSIYGMLETISDHIHGTPYCWPTLAAGITLTASDSAAWTLGSFVEIVPASTVASVYDIHFVSVEDLSANAVYELHLFYGDSDTYLGSRRFTKNANQDGTTNVTFQCLKIPANDKIRGKLASNTGNLDTATVSINYHTY